ncbi:MAG: aminotransferase class III-fold pyridoxal phosphate-dependent enzyme [Pseudomonadota bacterium]
MNVSTTLSNPNSKDSPSQRLMQITPRPAAVMARGAGSWLWDEAGRRYIDCLQGWAVNALGHSAPEVTQALAAQAQLLITPSPALHNRPQLEFAQLLTQLTGMDEVHFSNSGAEANEVAIKLARKWGRLHKAGAHHVISTHNGFHGRTLTTMAVSGKPGWDALFPPYPSGFHKVAFGDLSAMAEAITDQTVAIMVEPVQGEAGVVVPPDGYLIGLRKLADERNVLLIFDEIQTGIGRLGAFTASELFSVAPDIMTLGKGIGNGLPLSATLSTRAVSCFEYGDQGGTYNGNPLMTCVGQAVVEVVKQPEFLAHVTVMGECFRERLMDLSGRFAVEEVRGFGLLNAVRLSKANAVDIVQSAFELGLLVNAARPDVLRFMPSLRITQAELDVVFDRLRQAFELNT